MSFDSAKYGEEVAAILALDGSGERLMPLSGGRCSSRAASAHLTRTTARELFGRSRAPEAALSGLWLYFSCLDESHSMSQAIHTPDGSFWHGIMHRQEPDPTNSGYWFRRVGGHPVFPKLAEEAARLTLETSNAGAVGEPLSRPRVSSTWDPFAFIDFCEQARRHPGSVEETLALRIQRAEWQILFDYCASPA
ncbi:MAG: hypothetical protein IANPNBLG_00930 [Bryobacteraceae bacterium]|nr:hypothetical protein [Bryobacteraceae bacterium]